MSTGGWAFEAVLFESHITMCVSMCVCVVVVGIILLMYRISELIEVNVNTFAEKTTFS